MLKDFVSNAAILIASFSVMGVLFKDKPIRINAPRSSKLYWGLCFGILGNVLMVFSIQINASTIADLRHLAIVIAATFGGFIPALFSAVLIAAGRILLFGINESSILGSIGALLTGIFCGCISNINLSRTLKAFLMNLIGLFFVSIIFIIRIEDLQILKNVLTLHYFISLIGGFIAYHFFVFVVKSYEAQNQLKHSLMKLKETEERFRLIAEYSSDMITMHNENAEYKYISPAVKEIIHYEYPELLDKNMYMFIHPDDIEHTNEMFEKALEEGAANSTYRYRTNLGDYVWIESALKSVHFEEDGSKKVIIVSRNITDRKLTEQKLQEANELLNRLSYMDGLTGIANRRYFDETLVKDCSNCSYTHSPITLIMFDIDYFKKYNDTYGHLTGDACLQSIAQAINNQITTINSNCTFCRYGGEEFALISPSTGVEEGMKIAKQIQDTIRLLAIPHLSSEITDIITLSMGVATIVPSRPIMPQELIKMADEALYVSKTKGRNTITTAQLSLEGL
ncbi:diguanylate cyclase [Neobacillus sp. SuZ13]|uniref:diguanylate cyclase domain-containing protein n=1 Tax=Neobacillus sp. SuZ13 TaxID=3047875 RepID=UPI0024BF66D5|nr:diguanylate cyclase [Neobacillus sp. SuZ13]WHY68194.1 diguanylate cyclase [Neobacillus sp. SuZ13]